jgi:hypothetical protein
MRRLVARLGVLLVLSVATGCSSLPVTRTYLGSSSYGVSLSTPPGWQVFSSEEMLGRPTGGPPFLQGFGLASTDPADPVNADQPAGVLLVTFHGSFADAAAAARNAYLLDLDRAIADGAASILSETEPWRAGGFEHRQWLLEVRPTPGTVVKVIQRVSSSVEASSLDPTGRPVHANKTLIVGCRVACFDASTQTIDEIVASWKVSS